MTIDVQIGTMLSDALRDWSLDEASLAARAGVDLQTARETLRGRGDVSDLDAVARALGGTLDDVLAGRRFWEAPAVAFKSAPPEVEAPLVRAALLRVAGAARDRAALHEILGLSDPAREGRVVFSPVAPVDDVVTQAEDLARNLRVQIGNEREPILSVRDVMRSLGVWTFLTDLGSPSVDGLLWRDPDGRACAIANVQARGGKLSALRMTFAHELCHALFDGSRDVAYGLIEHRTERREALERRANAFAAHLLAPRDAVVRFLAERGLGEKTPPTAWHLRALSDHFAMGVEALAGHLVTCGYWERTDMHRFTHLTTRQSVGPDNRELNPTDAETAVVIERRGDVLALASLALDRGEITVGRWRELLGLCSEDDWRSVLVEQQVTRDVEYRSDQ